MRREPQQSLRIRTIEHLGHRVGVPVKELESVMARHADLYSTFPKKCSNGKIRQLFVADSRLRTVLVGIKKLLREVAVPKEIIGGRPGGTLTAFALPHARRPFVMEMDIKGFYPNTKPDQVRSLFEDGLRCTSSVADLLTGLTTAQNQLPQGFNTSCDIGNLLLRPCVRRLAGLCEKQGFSLTVWVDNIVFSGDGRLPGFKRHVCEIVEKCGFTVGRCVSMPHSKPQTVCGITVNDGLSVRRATRREIEEAVLATIGAVGDGDLCRVCPRNARRLRQKLRGRIQSVRNVNPSQARHLERLFTQLRGVGWDCVCE